MKKETIKLECDLIWNLKRDAKNQNKPVEVFVRELHEFWKKSSQNATSIKDNTILKNKKARKSKSDNRT